jgi:hypothetical protein
MKNFNNDNEFDSFLRGKMKDASLSPPNYERAWNNINHNLSHRPRNKRKMSRAVVFMFPILTLLLYYAISYTPVSVPRVDRSQLMMVEPNEHVISSPSVSDSSIKDNTKKGLAHSLYNKEGNQIVAPNDYIHSTKGVVNNHKGVLLQTLLIPKESGKLLDAETDLTQQAPVIIGIDIPLSAAMNGVLSIFPSKDIQQESIQTNQRTARNVYVGIHRNITNSWILNQNTYQIFGSDHLGLAMYWGGSWGNHVGWDLRKNVTIEIGANWLASHGQIQRDTKFGRKASFEVDMLYHQFPLLIKRKHTPIILGRRVTAYAEGGIQYARLLLARQQVNYTDRGGIYTRFNEDEISILAGYSLDIPLSRRVFLNTALRGRISNNINAKDWRINGDYGKSHNLAVGVTIGLNYRFASLK